MSHKERTAVINNVYSYLQINKIKAFYSILDDVNYELGARAFLQVAGIGKLKPNVLMIGYKNDWMACNKDDLLSYFNVLQ